MKSISILMAILLSIGVSYAQIKNTKTETVKIYGNCGMCKSTIEKAGNIKKVSEVVWNEDTQTATLSYDTTKTNQDEILKRIALVGYDSDNFLAPDEVYAKLPKCCQYDRMKKTETTKMEIKDDHSAHNHNAMNNNSTEVKQPISPLKAVFEYYFALKDALVASDGTSASTKAKDLLAAIKTLEMNKLSTEEHTVFMKVQKDLVFDAEHISETQDAGHQRDHFITLSSKLYELLKIAKHNVPVFYQHCPMANGGKGANWLSKENDIKNPYYGAKMLSCGKTVETIK
jgi:copper chaperone CopZ